MKSGPIKIGAFGTGNLGDDLMLQAILKEERNVNVVAYGPPCLADDFPYILTSEFMARSTYYISNATSLDFGGGNLFWSLENLSDMLVLTQQAKLLGLPVRLMRVGLQGFERNEIYSKLLLSLVDSMSVRDTQSLHIAHQLGREDCVYVRDYAFELFDEIEFLQASRFPIKKVGINFSDNRFTSMSVSDEQFKLHISGIFSELARYFEGSLEFFYIPFCNHRSHLVENDLIAGAILWEASDGLIQYSEGISTTDDLIEEVKTLDVLLGRRFHMQVLGHGLGKVVIPLVQNVMEYTKFNALARDKKNVSIPYEGVSQGFTFEQVKRRLSHLLVKD